MFSVSAQAKAHTLWFESDYSHASRDESGKISFLKVSGSCRPSAHNENLPCPGERFPEILSTIFLFFANYFFLLSFSLPPGGVDETPEILHRLEHGDLVVEEDPYRSGNSPDRYSDNRIVASLQLQLEQRGPPLLSRETPRF